jgi:hypothetical protein
MSLAVYLFFLVRAFLCHTIIMASPDFQMTWNLHPDKLPTDPLSRALKFRRKFMGILPDYVDRAGKLFPGRPFEKLTLLYSRELIRCPPLCAMAHGNLCSCAHFVRYEGSWTMIGVSIVEIMMFIR